jgi:hypothetical protein
MIGRAPHSAAGDSAVVVGADIALENMISLGPPPGLLEHWAKK